MKAGAQTDLIGVIEDVLASHEAVTLAYLFGSQAAGKAGPLSDIDIAALADPEAPAPDALGALEDDLCRRLRTDRIDMVNLARAPAHLAYRVIRDGRCLLCRDRRIKESFEVRTIMTYLDFKPIRERAFAASRRAILEAV